MTTDTTEAPAAYGSQLSRGHLAELQGSMILPEIIEERGYRTVSGSEAELHELRALRIPRWAWRDATALPGLLIPMHRATGEVVAYQWKPATPQEAPGGKKMKYASQAGAPNHLDVPQAVADKVRDPSESLWLTEGVKKGDALASHGRAVISLTGVFNWKGKHGTLGDWEDIPLRGRPVVICFDSDARHNRTVLLAMKRFGAWLESKGVSEVYYLIVPEEVSTADGTSVKVKGVDDFFAAGGTLKDLGACATKELSVDGGKDAAFSDAVLADTVCSDELDGQYTWSQGLGWMQWTGKLWQPATDAAVTEAVRQWALDRFSKVLDSQRADPNKDLKSQMDGWRGALARAKITNLVALSRGILESHPDDFDADPDLLNCPNGVVDLRTGLMSPHDPDLRMTKITGAEYVKGAAHPDWDKALQALPAEILDWYQLRKGQAITGHMTSDDLVIIQHGGGSNGKSAVLGATSNAAGTKASGYYLQVADRALLGNGNDNHPTELMDFMGARYAVLEETPEARRLDTNRMKKVAGTEQITARRIAKDPVTFNATHSLFLNTNHKPVVDETDHGTWRRLALVTFPYTFRKDAGDVRGPMDRLGDPTLRERCKTDPQVLEAALAWMVEGARRWYAAGRIMPLIPERVARDTLAWRAEADPVLSFINNALTFDYKRHVLSSELYQAYNDALTEKGQRPCSDRTFTERFGSHDLCSQNAVTKKKIRRSPGLSTRQNGAAAPGTYAAWLGLKFKEEGDDPEEDLSPTSNVPAVPDVKVAAQNEVHVRPYETSGTAGTRSTEPFSGNASIGNVPDIPGPREEAMEPSHSVTAPEPTAPVNPFDDWEPEPPNPEGGSSVPAATDPNPFGDWDPPVQAAPEPPAAAPVVFSGTLGDAVGFDLETAAINGLWVAEKDGGFVRLPGSVGPDGESFVHNDTADLVRRLEAATEIYGHNIFQFDLAALAREAGDPGLYDRLAVKAVDTLPLARVADPPGSRGQKPWGQKGYYGLDQLAVRQGHTGKTDDIMALAAKHAPRDVETGLPRTDKESVEAGLALIPTDDPEYNSYLHGDLAASRSVRTSLQPVLDTPYGRREMRVAYVQNRMTFSGWRVDEDLLRERADGEEAKRQASLQWLASECGVPLDKEIWTGRGANRKMHLERRLSPLGSKEGKAALIEAFHRAGAEHVPLTASKVLSTSSDAMGEGSYFIGKGAAATRRPGMLNPKAYGDNQAVREICEHVVEVTGATAKYAEILKYVVTAPDGTRRVHASIGAYEGADQASGRWAMTHPSLTNLGKRGGKVVQRAVFLPEPGEVLLAFDLDQVDMRAIAGHCQDPAYMALFGPGSDAHSMIADQVFGRHDGEWREKAKRIGHGWNYGMSVAGIANSGVELELAQKFDAGMHNAFPTLMEWRSQVIAKGTAGQLLDNGFGRLMRCDPQRAYTQAPALMGQGGARDIMCQALLNLPQEYVPWLRGVVHDEIVMSVPEARVEEVRGVVADAMTFDFKGVPITAGGSAPGANWAECYAK